MNRVSRQCVILDVSQHFTPAWSITGTASFYVKFDVKLYYQDVSLNRQVSAKGYICTNECQPVNSTNCYSDHRSLLWQVYNKLS
jgi:hypothetical protein